MDYPPDFPEHLKAGVEQVIAEAEIKYGARLEHLERHVQSNPGMLETSTLDSMIIYVHEVALALAEQSLRAVAEGHWTLEKARKSVEGFRYRITYDIFFDRHPNPSITKFLWFNTETAKRIQTSTGWLEYQKRLALLARSMSAKEHRTRARTGQSQDKFTTRAQKRKAFVTPILEGKGMSASQWADRIGCDTSVVYDYLNGKSRPRPRTRKEMAEALGVDASELPQ